MNSSLSVVGLFEIESMSVLVLLFTVVYVSYQYPRLLPGGQGVPLTGSITESTLSQETCGLDCIVCVRTVVSGTPPSTSTVAAV